MMLHYEPQFLQLNFRTGLYKSFQSKPVMMAGRTEWNGVESRTIVHHLHGRVLKGVPSSVNNDGDLLGHIFWKMVMVKDR